MPERLIDAEALKANLPVVYSSVIDAIDNAPTVDAVKVVRCKDCDHFRAQRIYNGEPEFYACCRANGYSTGDSHFCAWGEQSIIPQRYRYTAGCISYYDEEREEAKTWI